ncbi:cytochrome C [Shewanella xiamenensis]|uniref:Cytochrome C n=1 Tax=Shewanella xiamenensis TaxID=332186 RepID=A0AAE4TL89_9GAMM|nr:MULTISPECIES: cytochrome c [Shewanella]ASF15772.1 cytochrome C [Shewanella sp. FDAARGOS_354]MBW0295523.1 cytochrome C [Shewanella xiamenensis]MCR4534237.1 cytochrome C [Shewanella xiamenensis]MCT8871256.1 cytochrome C [Shewanella xiamenensis]MDG5901737.1 cytochrome C [Shewanella xiamenensis]
MLLRVIYSAGVLMLLLPAVTHADESNKLLNMCKACHGESGMSRFEHIPNIGWQNSDYLLKQLRAFKAGTRQDPTMTKVAQLLSEADMQQMAEYFYLGKDK